MAFTDGVISWGFLTKYHKNDFLLVQNQDSNRVIISTKALGHSLMMLLHFDLGRGGCHAFGWYSAFVSLILNFFLKNIIVTGLGLTVL